MRWLLSLLGRLFHRPHAPTTPADPQPAAPATPASPSPPAEFNPAAAIMELITLHNQVRMQYSLPSFGYSSIMAQMAQDHANWMAENDTLSHDEDSVSFSDRIKHSNYRFSMAGENIAQGQKTARAVLDAWMGSHGHRANILNQDYWQIGCGAVSGRGGVFWCVLFGTPRPRSAVPPTVRCHCPSGIRSS